MKWFNSSIGAAFHFAAWLIFLPLLLFFLFRSVPGNSYVLNEENDKIILGALVALVGVVNSGLLIPRLLYFKKMKYYLLTAFLLILLSSIFDFTLSSAISPMISYIESISWSRVMALSAALILSTSIRLIHDQNKSEQISGDEISRQ